VYFDFRLALFAGVLVLQTNPPAAATSTVSDTKTMPKFALRPIAITRAAPENKLKTAETSVGTGL